MPSGRHATQLTVAPPAVAVEPADEEVPPPAAAPAPAAAVAAATPQRDEKYESVGQDLAQAMAYLGLCSSADVSAGRVPYPTAVQGRAQAAHPPATVVGMSVPALQSRGWVGCRADLAGLAGLAGLCAMQREDQENHMCSSLSYTYAGKVSAAQRRWRRSHSCWQTGTPIPLKQDEIRWQLIATSNRSSLFRATKPSQQQPEPPGPPVLPPAVGGSEKEGIPRRWLALAQRAGRN